MKRILLTVMFVLSLFLMGGCEIEEHHHHHWRGEYWDGGRHWERSHEFHEHHEFHDD